MQPAGAGANVANVFCLFALTGVYVISKRRYLHPAQNRACGGQVL